MAACTADRLHVARARCARRNAAGPGPQGAVPVLRPRPRRDPGPARPAPHRPPRRRLSLLSLPAAGARTRPVGRGGTCVDHDACRRHVGRPRRRRRDQLAEPRRTQPAAGLRRRRHAVHPCDRLGPVAGLSRAGVGRRLGRGLHRRRPRRRSLDVHQRLLGFAQHCDHRTPAVVVFHRGQRLWHLGASRAANARRQRSREPRSVRQPEDPLGRGLRSIRRGDADRRGRQLHPRGRRTGPAAASRAAPLRALRAGYTSLQECRRARLRAGQGSAAGAAPAAGAGRIDRCRLGVARSPGRSGGAHRRSRVSRPARRSMHRRSRATSSASGAPTAASSCRHRGASARRA